MYCLKDVLLVFSLNSFSQNSFKLHVHMIFTNIIDEHICQKVKICGNSLHLSPGTVQLTTSVQKVRNFTNFYHKIINTHFSMYHYSRRLSCIINSRQSPDELENTYFNLAKFDTSESIPLSFHQQISCNTTYIKW